MQHDFGELRSLLQQPPSKNLWELVTGLVATWPDGDERDALIAPYVSEHIRRWPNALREIPKSWLVALARDEISEPVFSLGRVVHYEFYLHDALTCEDVASLLATHDYGQHIHALWLNAFVPHAIGDVFGALKQGRQLNNLQALSVALNADTTAYAKHCLPRARSPLSCFMLKRGRLNCLRWLDWLIDLNRDHQLRQLCLVDQDLGAPLQTARHLLSWSGWSTLERSHLFGCFVDEGLSVWIETLFGHGEVPWFGQLTTLDLGGNQMVDQDINILARAENLPQLEVLAVHINPLGEDALSPLLDGALPSLRLVIAPPQCVTPRQIRRFAEHHIDLIPSEDARPLVTQPAYWALNT